MNQYRIEHPRPQMYRPNWQNLNGEWDFAFDFSVSKREQNFHQEGSYTHRITVPFCPESELSGIHFTDFIPAVWYRRSFQLDDSQRAGRVLVHFGAVDYQCEVWINGQQAGGHRGGYASFTLDITDFCQAGENTLTLYAVDDTRSGRQPSGKQSDACQSYGCFYTRTTGIWQTVWLEFVPDCYIRSLKMDGDVANSLLHLEAKLNRPARGELEITAVFEGRVCGQVRRSVCGTVIQAELAVDEMKLWDIGQPNLYDLTIRFIPQDGGVPDELTSYFGFRTIEWRDKKCYLNGRSIFQRLVLDQGFYPDGIYTAPSDEALRRDIQLAMDLGFNGARMHEKVFEERYLYWADRMGYLIWGEFPNWGLDITDASGTENFLPEWVEVVQRDYNHPALIGWCPFNETWDQKDNGKRQDDEVLRLAYQVTRALDPCRPIIDTSGNFHVVTDIYDIHWYEQEPEKFQEAFRPMAEGGPAVESHPQRQQYAGQPYMVSEYGGTWWSSQTENAWGYGQRPDTEEEVCRRYVGLTETLLDNPYVCGLCYTQLYDVEQEQNGLYTYHREKKFSDGIYDRMIKAMTKKAAVED